MINRQALIAILAVAATVENAHAFTTPSLSSIQPRSHRTTSSRNAAEDQSEPIADSYQQITDVTREAEKLPTDIPPMPVVAEPASASAEPSANQKPVVVKKAPQEKGSSHKEGVFSPIVVVAGTILGEDQLKKIRAKIIGVHSDLIKSFVATSDSEFGKGVLRTLYDLIDTDNSGYLDKSEVTVALNMLGFKWLGKKEVDKIFKRADTNGDLEISLEEFMVETPKTLKINLIKLAKANGGDMGWMV